MLIFRSVVGNRIDSDTRGAHAATAVSSRRAQNTTIATAGTRMSFAEIVQEILAAGRRLDALGFVPATDGNISVRLSAREIVATASGVRKGALTEKDVVVIDPDGVRLRGAPKVSSEILMHLEIYRRRPDAMAVVHAHPPTATGFAVAGIPLQQCVLPEVVATIGAIPLAPYATPSTADLPASIRDLVAQHDAILLSNHGAVTFGPDLFQAANRMETVEQFAKILFVARGLGQVNLLTSGQVDAIQEIRGRYGFTGSAPACLLDADPRAGRSPAAGRAEGTSAVPVTPKPAASTPAASTPAAPAEGGPDPALVRRIADEVLRVLTPGRAPEPAAPAAPPAPAVPPARPSGGY